MSTAMADGRQADTQRRRRRVVIAISQTSKNATPISVSSVARQAGVDRAFLYRHRDLLAMVHAAELTPPQTPSPDHPSAWSLVSLQADLANAHARNTRLQAQTRCLEKRLSQLMGEQAWRASGLGAPADYEELQRQAARLERADIELSAKLEEKQAELDAARAANREPTQALDRG
ncbi:DUF6262 family protein [Streptomyces europaeiscabiei]|uniref:DUF6262 family protein n=1 Tax=Streptomyces europaeiscabiei TaxID=146819 RepID=UPI002E29AD1C|nr:DUF6262 family protein [Streptomyces europaeiscabiei]